jgi:hypothetical protein
VPTPPDTGNKGWGVITRTATPALKTWAGDVSGSNKKNNTKTKHILRKATFEPNGDNSVFK